MNLNIEATTDEWKRIRCAAKFSGVSVAEFVKNWTIAGIEACEDDYILHDGEVIGDDLEIEGLAQKVLDSEQD